MSLSHDTEFLRRLLHCRTFAHMISLTKSTDVEVAECMKKSCDGNREINRRQQLLFYAGRLLKDKKAHNILKPIKKELASLSGGTEYMLETQKYVISLLLTFMFEESFSQ